MYDSMAMPSAGIFNTTGKHKVEKLVLTISDHLEELSRIHAIISLRPESEPPVNPETTRDSLVRLQTKLSNLLVKNKTHLMDPIHDEVLFQVRRIQNSSLKDLRDHVRFLARTEEEELNKQRWRTRANVTLQESTIDLPSATAPRQLQHSRSHTQLQSQYTSQSRLPPSPPQSCYSRSRSHSRSRTPLDPPSHEQQQLHVYTHGQSLTPGYHHGSRMRSPSDPPVSSTSQRTLRYDPDASCTPTRRARAHTHTHTQQSTTPTDKPSRLPLPVKPNTELILIGWIQGDEPSPGVLASVYDPSELSMPAMPPTDGSFDPSRPLRLPSWGEAPSPVPMFT